MLLVLFLIAEISPSANTQSLLVATTLAAVFGICTLFLLSIISLLLICLWLRRPTHKQKETSYARPEDDDNVYDNPGALLADNVQPCVLQNMDTKAAESTFQDETEDTGCYMSMYSNLSAITSHTALR